MPLTRIPVTRPLLALVAVLLGIALLRATEVPRGARAYIPDHAVLPAIGQQGDSVRIENVRAFRYAGDTAIERTYVTRTHDLRDVRAVWYVLSPFASWRGPAHAFLSFEFADSTYLSVSVEARRERGEVFSPVGGLLRRYELQYVIGEEADVIGLRTNVWQDPVYLYPTTATPEQARRLLERVLRRAEGLRERPEYYHTLTNNCATNLADALNAMSAGRAPWHVALVLPGFSDDYAWLRGLLALSGPPARERERYRINERARRSSPEGFSRTIRAGL